GITRWRNTGNLRKLGIRQRQAGLSSESRIVGIVRRTVTIDWTIDHSLAVDVAQQLFHELVLDIQVEVTAAHRAQQRQSARVLAGQIPGQTCQLKGRTA